ncbi:adenylosuccinate lyase [Psittacicella gerlachiana]|uniref:Adenylosuccinate lyase n=1 Tax=Psittacicella gerlachiana TaxID=2028574 RepID=A0A3A1YHW4_9GAMM|nr:adenylosuccinate lyase [Psittacicella gerlachiana]RIY36798.1 adenylosuccinate lyase [Psittacicella gerlachiana]
MTNYSSFDAQSPHNFYDYPLCSRYASEQMKHIFSPNFKFSTWRKLWVILAESEQELGLDFISDAQIQQLKDNIYNIDFAAAHAYELQLKHDVMAHVHAYGDVAPLARKIIHLGVTSAYVGDNTDLIQIKEGLLLVKQRLVTFIATLAKFAEQYKDLPTLGYTHFQAAQLTTVGKRATLWLKSFMFDLAEVEHRLETLEFRGVKGTTGTAASFKELFGNDFQKVVALDKMVTERAGFKHRQEVSGQTYDRKQDSLVLQTLANLASSAHKFTNDFRLLQHLKELEEPFAKKQIGSSAMAYKRNPMRCERISALAKFVLSLEMNGHLVHSTQWFERTLDDSANKRLSYPQAFLAIDAILLVLQNIAEGIVVYEKMITRNVMRELPFMATEDIIMDSVKKGMDRQEVHEIIRELSMEQARLVKQEGQENKLIEAILADGRLPINAHEIKDLLNPSNYIGFAPQQVEAYLQEVIQPMLERNQEFILTQSQEFGV